MISLLRGVRRGRLKYVTALLVSFTWPTVWSLRVIELCEHRDGKP